MRECVCVCLCVRVCVGAPAGPSRRTLFSIHTYRSKQIHLDVFHRPQNHTCARGRWRQCTGVHPTSGVSGEDDVLSLAGRVTRVREGDHGQGGVQMPGCGIGGGFWTRALFPKEKHCPISHESFC